MKVKIQSSLKKNENETNEKNESENISLLEKE